MKKVAACKSLAMYVKEFQLTYVARHIPSSKTSFAMTVWDFELHNQDKAPKLYHSSQVLKVPHCYKKTNLSAHTKMCNLKQSVVSTWTPRFLADS